MSVKSAIYLDNANPQLSNKKLVFALVIVTLMLSMLALDREGYLESQKDIFLKGNEALQVLPANLWQNITSLGDVYVVIPILSFICLFSSRSWAAMFGAIPLAGIFTDLGKKFFAMPRPASTFEIDQFNVIGSAMTNLTSFPSGHTITVFTAMSAICFVTLKGSFKNQNAKYLITAALFLIATATAISRVAVGAHWPADIIAGAALGILSGMSGEYLTRRYSGWWRWLDKNELYLGLSVIFFSALLMFLTITGEVFELPIVWISIIVSAIVGVFISLKAACNH